MEGFIGDFDTHFGEHKFFKFFQKPLSTDSFHISWRIDIYGYVCEVLVLFIWELHKF